MLSVLNNRTYRHLFTAQVIALAAAHNGAELRAAVRAGARRKVSAPARLLRTARTASSIRS